MTYLHTCLFLCVSLFLWKPGVEGPKKQLWEGNGCWPIREENIPLEGVGMWKCEVVAQLSQPGGIWSWVNKGMCAVRDGQGTDSISTFAPWEDLFFWTGGNPLNVWIRKGKPCHLEGDSRSVERGRMDHELLGRKQAWTRKGLYLIGSQKCGALGRGISRFLCLNRS